MELYQVVLITVATFVLPGALLSWLSGLRLPWALAASVPVSFGTFGLAAWLLGQWEVPFSVRSYLLVWAGFVVLAGLWRLAYELLRRRQRANAVDEEPSGKTRLRGGTFDARWLLPALGVATGMWLIIGKGLDLFKLVPHQLENIVQGWDVHWHASVVRWIMEEAVADPTRMGELRNFETGAQLYYPSAWHTGAFLAADLSDMSPIAAINVVSVVLPGLLLPLAAAMIAWKMVGRGGLVAQIAAGVAGIAVAAVPVLMWVGTYVGAWPYLAAVGAAGVVMAMFMHVPYRPVSSFAAALALAGVVQLHPSAVTIVVIPLLLWWLLSLVWTTSLPREILKQHRWGLRIAQRFKDVGWLALSGGVGTGILLPQLLSGSEENAEVSSFTAFEDVTREQSWEKAFFMQTRHTDFFPEFDPTLLLWMAGVGAVVLIVWRQNFWAPLFYLFSAWMTANSLWPFGEPWGEWLDLVASLHYSTAHRLIMPVALFTVAAAGVGVAALVRLLSLAPLQRWWPKAGVPSAVASILLGLGAGYATYTWASSDEVIDGVTISSIAPRTDDRMVSDIDLRAFDWLAQQPKAYEGSIMGEPADGHGWMYAYNGLPSIMRHYLWPNTGAETDTDMLFWNSVLLGVGNHDDPEQENDVDKAAKNLGVNYFFVSPWSFWAFQEPNFSMIDGLWHTPGVTPVYREGNVAIFAVNQAFSDVELEQMRAPGNSPEELPPLEPDANGNLYHRPSKPDMGGPTPLEIPGSFETGSAPFEIPATRP